MNKQHWCYGQSPAIRPLAETIKHITASKAIFPLVISGPIGSGRSSLARYLHLQQSKNGYIASTYCAANPDLLPQYHILKFNQKNDSANTETIAEQRYSTLVLEDIEFLSTVGQSRLAALCDNKGGHLDIDGKSKYIRFNVICTTSLAMDELLTQGQYWPYLYHKLNTMPVTIPPLKDRLNDLAELSTALLAEICTQLQCPPAKLNSSALKALLEHNWNSNMRELNNTLKRTLINAKNPQLINKNDIIFDTQIITDTQAIAQDGHSKDTTLPDNVIQAKQADQESLSLEDYFQNFLLRHQDSMSETELARKLGISRKCLWERRQRFSIAKNSSNTASQTSQD